MLPRAVRAQESARTTLLLSLVSLFAFLSEREGAGHDKTCYILLTTLTRDLFGLCHPARHKKADTVY